jgi:hypothetical protein
LKYPKQIVVAIDQDSSAECLYINGKAWSGVGEYTVYATDIAEAAGNSPITFEHREVVCPIESRTEYVQEYDDDGKPVGEPAPKIVQYMAWPTQLRDLTTPETDEEETPQ